MKRKMSNRKEIQGILLFVGWKIKFPSSFADPVFFQFLTPVMQLLTSRTTLEMVLFALCLRPPAKTDALVVVSERTEQKEEEQSDDDKGICS